MKLAKLLMGTVAASVMIGQAVAAAQPDRIAVLDTCMAIAEAAFGDSLAAARGLAVRPR